MTARNIAATVVLATISVVTVASAASSSGAPSALDEVRTATASFHSVNRARAAGYEPFLDCFDSEDGGMGQHLVNRDLVADLAVDATSPEALVYEVRGDRLKLVGVEYIVPVPEDPAAAAAMRADPPELFGVPFHENTALGVMVLHAWIWRDNPSGVFLDWNPDVDDCPTS